TGGLQNILILICIAYTIPVADVSAGRRNAAVTIAKLVRTTKTQFVYTYGEIVPSCHQFCRGSCPNFDYPQSCHRVVSKRLLVIDIALISIIHHTEVLVSQPSKWPSGAFLERNSLSISIRLL